MADRQTTAIVRHDYWCPVHDGRDCMCSPEVEPTEVDGIKVGDDVLVGNRWPATVLGFLSTHRCDLIVRWTGKRPSLDKENTICRRHADVRLAHSGSSRDGGDR